MHPPWPDVRKHEFLARYGAGATNRELAREFDVNEKNVTKRAHALREEGFKVPRRPTIRPDRPTFLAGAELILPTMEGHAVQLATIYTPDGRAIETMDPRTRQRTRL